MCPFLPLQLKMIVFAFFPYFASRNMSYSPVEMINVKNPHVCFQEHWLFSTCFFLVLSAAVAAAIHLTDGEKKSLTKMYV